MSTLRNKPIVVTGTGTDAGKTHLAAALLREWSNAGTSVVGIKPVETGYSRLTSDAQRLAEAARRDILEPYYTATAPISPHLAARHTATSLAAAVITQWVHANVHGDNPLVVVETAGGLFTPLSLSESMLDLIKHLDPCVFVLVALNRLGTLHDVRAAVKAAAAEHRAPDVVLLNTRDPDFARLNNAGELEALGLTMPIFDIGGPVTLAAAATWLKAQALSTPHRK